LQKIYKAVDNQAKYNIIKLLKTLQGRVKVPTGGYSPRAFWHEWVKLPYRQYSLDGRS